MWALNHVQVLQLFSHLPLRFKSYFFMDQFWLYLGTYPMCGTTKNCFSHLFNIWNFSVNKASNKHQHKTWHQRPYSFHSNDYHKKCPSVSFQCRMNKSCSKSIKKFLIKLISVSSTWNLIDYNCQLSFVSISFTCACLRYFHIHARHAKKKTFQNAFFLLQLAHIYTKNDAHSKGAEKNPTGVDDKCILQDRKILLFSPPSVCLNKE